MQRVATDTLKNLSSLERLTELFCRDLNYGYSSSVISKRTWKEQIANSVKELSLIGTQGDFHIIYCQIEKLLLGIERPIINQLLKEHPYLLAIFSDPQFTNWHFVNVKYDEELKNRRLFRRIVIGPDERLHTAAQRINMLEVVDEKMSPLELQIEHDKAFDVEEVTKEFYNKFTDIFHILDKDIAEENPQLDTAKQAQIILNRLIFLYFIQKKGWLNNNKRYLYENFLTYWKKNPKGNSFYSDFLFELFQALSSQNNLYKDILGNVPFLNGGLFEVDPFPISPQLQPRLVIKNSTFKQIFDYLLEHFNFTVREDTPLDIEVAIDPEMLGKIFENLILKLEKSEDLRKKTGSYYTPRVIVHFMCQQSLKEYLGSESEIDKSKIESLFTMGPADQLNEEELKKLEILISMPQARLLKSLIKKAYILDPAVGSGAFLVGMLHEMLSIIKLSDTREFGQEYIQRSNYNYELKRELIETSLCGVDIQDQAIRICELRLWLSLIVDYEKVEGEDVPPLPNLSYKIRCGDSLIEKLFGHNVQLDQLVQTDKGRQLIDEIAEDKEAYFLARDIREKNRIELSTLVKQCELMELLIKEKQKSFAIPQLLPTFQETVKEREEREEFKKMKREYENILLSASNTRKQVEAMLKGKIPIPAEDIHNLKKNLGISFIWKLDFAEVFREKGGFDIIIANPPYIENKKIKTKDKETYKKFYQSAYKLYDLSILFIEKSIDLLKDRGLMIFITTNKFLATDYGYKIRKILLDRTSIVQLIDLSNVKVFKEAAAFPIILSYFKRIQENNKIKISPNINDINVFEDELDKKKETVFQKDFYRSNNLIFNISGHLSLCHKLSSKNIIKLGSLGHKFIYRPFGFIGWSEYLKKLSNSPEHGLKFIGTTSIFKYFVDWNKKIIIAKNPYQKKYFPYNEKFRNVFNQFKESHILIKEVAKTLTAAYSRGEYCHLTGVYSLLISSSFFNIKYILALLNSKLFNFFYNSYYGSVHLSGGYLKINSSYLKNLPFKKIPLTEQKPFVNLVDKILSVTNDNDYTMNFNKQTKAKEYQCQIDKMVYELYDLTNEEIALVEKSLK